MRPLLLGVNCMLFVVALAACPAQTDPPLTCVQGLSLDCKPLYDPPAYQTIFDKTLHPTCAAGKGTCHTADAAMGGLVFENADDAYALLLGQRDGRVRVIAGDPSCSLMMEKLTTKNTKLHMPPGPTSLLPSELCAITQWIAQGAKR